MTFRRGTEQWDGLQENFRSEQHCRAYSGQRSYDQRPMPFFYLPAVRPCAISAGR